MARQLASKTWIERYILVQKAADNRLFRLLQDAANDVGPAINRISGKSGVGAEVRKNQLIGARGAITRRLAYFWRDMGKLVASSRTQAQSEAIRMSFDWDEVLLKEAIPSKSDRDAIRDYLLSNAERNIDTLLARVFATHLPLSQKVYRTSQLANGWVERTVNSGLARGATAKEIANDVKYMINPETPGGVSYAAMRLSRTEINNAYHAQSVFSNLNKPWSEGMKWNKSRSHKTPDECDRLASVDNGFGPGVYSANSVPNKPHPQCLCYVVPELMPVEQFIRELRFGTFDAWMEENIPESIAQKRRNVN